LGFGLGVATVGVATYGSPWGWGYYSYWNPYWYGPAGGVTYINYAQPVAAAPPPAAAPAPQLPGPSDGAAESSAQANALATFEMARGLFKRGDYSLALTQANRAIAVLPNDSLMHEFRALCLFAMHDYQQSAAALYAVLSAGPGWDQATLIGLYPSPTVYQQQLRELESYRGQHPETPSARFVLAYHYMLSGKNEQAVSELQRVVELEPKDQLSAQLLKGLTTPNADQPPPQTAPPPSEPVDSRALAGSWQASRPDGSRFELYLGADGKFDWKYAQQDKQQHLSGTFTLADNYLILTARDQNALVGHVELAAGDKLKFKLAGGSPSDPGLTFSR
jgi:tetratricopeptide (TPR) repeat protein